MLTSMAHSNSLCNQCVLIAARLLLISPALPDKALMRSLRAN